jgi:membrane protease YdiL (CAAX protease family)
MLASPEEPVVFAEVTTGESPPPPLADALLLLAASVSLFRAIDFLPWPGVALPCAANVAVVAAIASWSAWRRRKLSRLGFGAGGVAFTARVAVVLAAGFATVGLGALALLRGGTSLRRFAEAASTPELETLLGALPLAALMLVLAPVAEELLFRGVVYGALRSKLEARWAAIAQAGLFAAWHIPWSRPTLADGLSTQPEAQLQQYLFALIAAWTVERRGSLGPAIALHVLGNAAALGLMALVTHRRDLAFRLLGF